MGALEGWGLAEVSWEACDARIGPLTASPEDAEGRGIALTVARDGEASDLTGATVALAWRHRATRRRGCDAFAAVDAAGGRFRIHYPRALAGCEGTVDARIVVSDGDSQISTLPFEIEVGRALGGGSESDEGWGLLADAIARYEEARSLAQEAAAAALAAADELRAAAARGDFDGQDGAPGAAGADGASPSASVAQTDAGAVITVSDGAGTTTATVLHGEPGAKGDPFTYEDFTAAQLEALRGPQGLPGADGADGAAGAPALKEIPGTIKTDVQTSQVMLSAGSWQAGDFAVGDYVLDPAMTLGRVTEVAEATLGRLSVKARYLARLRPDGLATCEGVDLPVGATTAAEVLVTGQDLAEGDLALSADTGCLCEVSDVGVTYLDKAYAKLTCVAALATREYVDAAVEALDDLAEVEF